MLRKGWDQGFSLSQTTATPTKPIPRHTWLSDRGVSCLLHLSYVFHLPLPDVRLPIFGQMKPGTAGSETVTAEPHSQRQRRDPQRALAPCAFCQLIPAMLTSTYQQQTISPLNFLAHRTNSCTYRRVDSPDPDDHCIFALQDGPSQSSYEGLQDQISRENPRIVPTV
jgi:hypothetical protein